MRIAISWSLKESCYGEAPHLPAIDAVLPQDLCELEKHVQELHTAHGTEVSFYWCYPFWVLAAQLQSQGIVVAGLRDCLLYTSPSPRDRTRSRMPSSA